MSNSKIEELENQLANCDGLIGELNIKIEERDKTIHAIKTEQVSYKVDIVNNEYDGSATRKCINISDTLFAFTKNGAGPLESITLLVKSEGCDWCEASDLTELRIWEYQELKKFAVAVGMIEEDEDLFI